MEGVEQATLGIQRTSDKNTGLPSVLLLYRCHHAVDKRIAGHRQVGGNRPAFIGKADVVQPIDISRKHAFSGNRVPYFIENQDILDLFTAVSVLYCDHQVLSGKAGGEETVIGQMAVLPIDGIIIGADFAIQPDAPDKVGLTAGSIDGSRDAGDLQIVTGCFTDPDVLDIEPFGFLGIDQLSIRDMVDTQRTAAFAFPSPSDQPVTGRIDLPVVGQFGQLGITGQVGLDNVGRPAGVGNRLECFCQRLEGVRIDRNLCFTHRKDGASVFTPEVDGGCSAWVDQLEGDFLHPFRIARLLTGNRLSGIGQDRLRKLCDKVCPDGKIVAVIPQSPHRFGVDHRREDLLLIVGEHGIFIRSFQQPCTQCLLGSKRDGIACLGAVPAQDGDRVGL